MGNLNPKLLLLMCNTCRGMTSKLLPEIMLRYPKEVRVLPVNCPSQTDPFAIIKLLKNGYDGVITACPKDACCCPENNKLLKRRVIMKDVLPVFGFSREQFQLASVSPLGVQELMEIIENMLSFVKMTGNKETYDCPVYDDDYDHLLKWVN